MIRKKDVGKYNGVRGRNTQHEASSLVHYYGIVLLQENESCLHKTKIAVTTVESSSETAPSLHKESFLVSTITYYHDITTSFDSSRA